MSEEEKAVLERLKQLQDQLEFVTSELEVIKRQTKSLEPIYSLFSNEVTLGTSTAKICAFLTRQGASSTPANISRGTRVKHVNVRNALVRNKGKLFEQVERGKWKLLEQVREEAAA